MEGVDVVRQAAEEAALDLDQQAMQELVRELPDYETEVLEEGDAPVGPGEYPGSIPDSPLPIPGPVLKCPIHRVYQRMVLCGVHGRGVSRVGVGGQRSGHLHGMGLASL